MDVYSSLFILLFLGNFLVSRRVRPIMVCYFDNGGRMKENLALVNHVEKVGSSVVNLKFECSFVM